MKSRAATWKYDTIESVLDLMVYVVTDASAVKRITPPMSRAVWDTGCAVSCISSAMIKRLGIKPTGTNVVTSMTETITVNTYDIIVFLTDDFYLKIKASEVPLCDFDVYLGMDVIRRGDFTVTNAGGKTVVSFIIPARNTIDFENA